MPEGEELEPSNVMVSLRQVKLSVMGKITALGAMVSMPTRTESLAEQPLIVAVTI